MVSSRHGAKTHASLSDYVPGNGGAASFYGDPAVTTYWDGTFNQINVWATGSDGHLYAHYFNATGWHTSARGHPDRSATTAVLEHGWEDRLCSIKPRCGRCPRPTVSDTTEPATVRTR